MTGSWPWGTSWLAVIEAAPRPRPSLMQRACWVPGERGRFSLQASKNLTGGEGGILICDDREVYERAMSMGTHPQRLYAELELPEFKEKIDSLAFNYRMHSMSAAMANSQLKYLEGWTLARGRNAQRLYDEVRDLPFINIPEPLLETERPPTTTPFTDTVLIPSRWTSSSRAIKAKCPGTLRARRPTCSRASRITISARLPVCDCRRTVVLPQRIARGERWRGGIPGDLELTGSPSSLPKSAPRCAGGRETRRRCASIRFGEA